MHGTRATTLVAEQLLACQALVEDSSPGDVTILAARNGAVPSMTDGFVKPPRHELTSAVALPGF